MITEFAGIDHPLARALAVAYGGVRHVDRVRRNLQPKLRPPRPTISVGNVTVGGTGKTPLVAELAAMVSAAERRAVVLMRGYLGSERGPARVPAEGSPHRYGDEAVMLARRGLAVWVAKRREDGVAAACDDGDVLILDDGFQRVSIERDLDLVTFGPQGLGNGRMLPAGILRDPPWVLRDADAFVGLRDHLPALYPDTPRFLFGHRGLLFHPQTPAPGARVAALAAIAYPSAFFGAIKAAGIAIQSEHPLRDHDPLLPTALEDLRRSWRDAGIDTLVVTEKDAVKLPLELSGLQVIVARSRYGPVSTAEGDAFRRFVRGRVVF